MKRLFLLIALLSFPILLYAKEFKVITFTTENAGKVYFDHDIHMQKLNNNCPVCHNSLYTIGKKNPTATMADMEKGKSCGVCHNKVKAFSVADCVRCHVVKEVPIEIPDFGTLIFSHKFHLGLYGCADCHNALFKAGPGNPHVSMVKMEEGVSCGACHDGKTAFSVKGDCVRCHTVKDITFGADALFSHKFHLDMYKCGDCHSKFFVAGPGAKRYLMIDMEKGQSCGGCHDGKNAFSVKGDCDKCHKGLKEVAFKATDALFSHKFHLGIYRCGDCHSGIFVGGVGARRYTMGDMEKDKSCGACHDANIAFTVSGNCDRCHRSTRDITFTIQRVGLVSFSHSLHKGMYKCVDCHNSIFTTGVQSKRYSMADMEKGKSCGACHDGKTAFTVAANCGKCHPVKDITFVDDARFGHDRHLEMYTCNDCHNALFKAGPGNKRYTMGEMEKDKSCGACHDDGIGFSVKANCDRCHKTAPEVAFKVAQTGTTPFSHKIHGGMYKCNDCHYAVFTTGVAARRFSMADMEKGKSCGACHDGKTAFTVKENCERCHPVKEIKFKQSAALFSHKFHIALYRCNECHDKLFIPGPNNRRYSMPDMEKGKSCGACHDSKTAFSVAGSCEKCHKPHAIKYEFPSTMPVKSVIFSHKVHLEKQYKCADCHYKIYAAGGRKSFTMKEMNEGKSCGACHGFAMAFSVKQSANCMRCHVDPSERGPQSEPPRN